MNFTNGNYSPFKLIITRREEHNITNSLKQNIDPQIVKHVEKEDISFDDIKKTEKKEKKIEEKKIKGEGNKKVIIPGERLLKTIKESRKELIINDKDKVVKKTENNKSSSDRVDKLQKLKDLLRELNQ
jgi:hypothetical protein